MAYGVDVTRVNGMVATVATHQELNAKLYKVPERGHLPQWVIDAYVNKPINLDLSLFK